jgi:hypothetical protein
MALQNQPLQQIIQKYGQAPRQSKGTAWGVITLGVALQLIRQEVGGMNATLMMHFG